MVPGVISADLNFASATLLVEYDSRIDPRAGVAATIRRAGLSLTAVGETVPTAHDEETVPTPWWRSHRTEVAVIGSGAFSALGWLVSAIGARGVMAPGTQSWAVAAIVCYALAIVFGETLLAPRALASLRARTVDMNVLMTVAVLGAVAIGQWSEAATVVFLFAVGGWLEARALARTRSSIRDLMDLTPPVARVRRDGEVVELALEAVAVGETLLVRPGERIALDGVVARGVSGVDEAPITGEAVPVVKTVGDVVFAGSLNTTGLLDVGVTSLAADSTLARIVFLVEEAQAARAPSQQIVERFSRVYTPVVVGLAALVAVVPPLLGSILGADALPFPTGWYVWLYRALVVLVAACPCALVISTPVTIVSAISRAGRDGVLVKGGAYLELAGRVRAVAFDKTGTLTMGRPAVTRVIAIGDGVADTVHARDRLLALAAALEAHSTHPLARAVVAAAAERGLDLANVSEFEELPGQGVSGQLSGVRVHVASPVFADEISRVPAILAERIAAAENAGATVLVIVEDGVAVGLIGVSDEVRAEVPLAVSRLREGGVEHLVMLTGDNARTAAAVAQRAGLSAHMARLLPQDKVDAVLRLRERWGVVAMVGDGINDAPALAAADLGIAMGAAGSDTALETADVALMADDLSVLPRFFALGRRTLAIIRQNVAFSVIVKVVVLTAAVAGYANMWLAVFADTGVALLVILNGMRLLGARKAPATGVNPAHAGARTAEEAR